MKWVRDRTGRFSERPYYQPGELDDECERLIIEFLRARHGNVEFPIITDDLTVLVEQAGAAFDPYADFSADKRNVDGLTTFVPGCKPLVQIARRLSENPRDENRMRTTISHQVGHVWFHGPLWRAQQASGHPLIGGSKMTHLCRRETIVDAPGSDWVEWQAGYVSGALLMPASYQWEVIRRFLAREPLFRDLFPMRIDSRAGHRLIHEVMDVFAVSEEAAKIRLLRQHVLTEEDAVQGNLFA